MKSKLSSLGVALDLGGLIFSGCGPTTEQLSALPTATAAVPTFDPASARDEALAYVIEQRGRKGPLCRNSQSNG